jgi:hypothetical protein
MFSRGEGSRCEKLWLLYLQPYEICACISELDSVLDCSVSQPVLQLHARAQLHQKVTKLCFNLRLLNDSTLPLIRPAKRKRVVVAFATSSFPFLLIGVPSAWCSERLRQ